MSESSGGTVPPSEVPIEVDVETVAKWLSERTDWLLIDCREPAEHRAASVHGAVLMPMSQWENVFPELQKMLADGKHPVVMCHHGARSLRVANWMRQNGYPTTQSMAGGIDAWSLSVDPTVPQY